MTAFRLGCALLVLLPAAPLAAAESPPGTDGWLKPGWTFRPHKAVDPKLFFLRALEDAYRTWPNLAADRSYISGWVQANRAHLLTLRNAAEKVVDDTLVKRLEECLRLLDDYEAFLRSADLDYWPAEPSVKTYADMLWDAGSRGLAVAGATSAAGPLALAAGGVTAGLSLVIDIAVRQRTKGANADEAARQRDAIERKVKAAAEAIDRNYRNHYKSAGVTAEKLRKLEGWAEEAGFDEFDRESTVASRLADRPTDPFAHAHAATRGLDKAAGSADELLARAGLMVRAAELVPELRGCEGVRAEYLGLAGRLARAATDLEARSSGYVLPTASAEGAVRLLRAAVQQSGKDAPAEIRFDLRGARQRGGLRGRPQGFPPAGRAGPAVRGLRRLPLPLCVRRVPVRQLRFVPPVAQVFAQVQRPLRVREARPAPGGRARSGRRSSPRRSQPRSTGIAKSGSGPRTESW